MGLNLKITKDENGNYTITIGKNEYGAIITGLMHNTEISEMEARILEILKNAQEK